MDYKFCNEEIYKMLFFRLKQKISGMIRKIAGKSGDTDGQNIMEANDDCWAVEIEGHGKTEEEQEEEIEQLQNRIKHLKELFLVEKSVLCAKINSLEHTVEKDNVMRQEGLKTTQDLEKLKNEIGQLKFAKQVFLNEQKLTNDRHEEDLKKLEMELKNESERVRQLNIQNKMVIAENQWLKNSLKQSQLNIQNKMVIAEN